MSILIELADIFLKMVNYNSCSNNYCNKCCISKIIPTSNELVNVHNRLKLLGCFVRSENYDNSC